MTFILAILFFTGVCFHLFIRLGDAEGRIALLETKANYCEQSEKTLRESVDLQTKCIRDLNDIVRKSVENKEQTEPDTKAQTEPDTKAQTEPYTKALLAGWIVDEPEPPKKQPRPIDVFRMQKLIDSLHCKNITLLYPSQQSELNQILGPYGFREEIMNEKIFS